MARVRPIDRPNFDLLDMFDFKQSHIDDQNYTIKHEETEGMFDSDISDPDDDTNLNHYLAKHGMRNEVVEKEVAEDTNNCEDIGNVVEDREMVEETNNCDHIGNVVETLDIIEMVADNKENNEDVIDEDKEIKHDAEDDMVANGNNKRSEDRFKVVTAEGIDEMVDAAVPVNTKRNTKFGVNLFKSK